LSFHKFCQKLATIEVTKKALNCAAYLQQLTAFLTPLASSGIRFCDLKTSFLAAAGFEFLQLTGFT